jgi:predicted RNase H-like nuclease
VSSRRGPDLPYTVVAGVTPWRTGWLAATAKLLGASFVSEDPKIYDSFLSVLQEHPSFSTIVVNAPIGYIDSPDLGVRTCDHEARALLGRRGGSIHNAPTRFALQHGGGWSETNLDAVTAALLPRYQEIAAEMSPYRQRTIFEGNPELSFYQLLADTPLHASKKIEEGLGERREILEQKVPGVSRILDAQIDDVPQKHLLDAAALLWTARRVFARAAKRLPAEAEWDSEGLRMEFVY